MTVGSIFFATFAVVALVGALSVVLARSPIRSALGLLGTILGMACLFLQLSAQFLAAIQLMVYAGAVVVLFVFVIMLLGPDQGAGETSAEPPKARLSRGIAAGLVAVFFAASLWIAAGAGFGVRELPPARPDHGTVEAMGQLLFTSGLVPFELSTALLVIAAIGAIAIARSKPTHKKVVRPASATERNFGGPVHPRDAVGPLATKEGV